MATTSENQWNENEGRIGSINDISGAQTSVTNDYDADPDDDDDISDSDSELDDESTVDEPEDDDEVISDDDDLDDEDETDDDDISDSYEEDADETPETTETDNEGSGYDSGTEIERPQEGNDASFSEQTDVTPPSTREFPSVGNAETDFVSRDHGRTTGRMVGHEPGTENNL